MNNNIPPFLNNQKFEKSICLILEGFEEEYYFRRLLSLSIFSHVYKFKIINAKCASNIPARYQDALASNSYSIVLIVCDMDRKPDEYYMIVKKIEKILGNCNAEKIITFTRPCILQIILLHFGEIELTTQAKPAAIKDVERLTGVQNYDAHNDQLCDICKQIFKRDWDEFQKRLELLSTNPKDIPSSNIKLLFKNLCSDNTKWIDTLNSFVYAT